MYNLISEKTRRDKFEALLKYWRQRHPNKRKFDRVFKKRRELLTRDGIQFNNAAPFHLM